MDLRPETYNETMSSVNGTTTLEDTLSIPAKIVSLIIVIWTIFANATIVLCFIRNHHNMWTSYSQVLSLSVNDVCLGIASLFMIIISFMPAVSKAQCSIAFYFFFSAQCAVLYNILVVCIHRALSIRKRTYSVIKPLYSGLMIFLGWFLSFVACALPFLLWRSDVSHPETCTAMTIFIQQKSAAKVIVLAYILPQMLTNVLYIIVVVKIYISLRKVTPVQTIEASTSSTSTNGRQRALLKLHSRVVGTIGILLLIMNACTVPLLWLYITWSVNGTMASRDTRYFGSCIFLMNSALNPFVYAGRTKHLREALKKMWNDYFKK